LREPRILDFSFIFGNAGASGAAAGATFRAMIDKLQSNGAGKK
jgi:hypothetical protein